MNSPVVKSLAATATKAVAIATLSAFGLAGTSSVALAGPAIAPPQSHPYGLSMAEWARAYQVWAIAPGHLENNVFGHVQFLSGVQTGVSFGPPTGSGTVADPFVFTGHADVTVHAGDSLLGDLMSWIGTLYSDGSTDPVLPDAWWGTYVTGQISLDGDTIVDNISEFYAGLQYFDPPLLFPNEQANGGIGEAFLQPTPFMLRPLSVGTHTLTAETSVLVPPGNSLQPETGLVFQYSLTITVVPGK